jgi:hypothetical protein
VGYFSKWKSCCYFERRHRCGPPGPNPVWSRLSSSQAESTHSAAVSNESTAAAWSSPQSGIPKANRSNIVSPPVKSPYASSTGAGGQTTAPTPCTGNNKSTKVQSKHVVNGSNAKVSVPDPTQSQAQTNGATVLAKSAASSAIVEAVHAHNHSHSNGNGSASLSTMTDHNEFVREVVTLIHVRSFSSFLSFLFALIWLTFFVFLRPSTLLVGSSHLTSLTAAGDFCQ